MPGKQGMGKQNVEMMYVLYAPGMGFRNDAKPSPDGFSESQCWGDIEGAVRFETLPDLLDAVSRGLGNGMIGLTPHLVKVTQRPLVDDMGAVS